MKKDNRGLSMIEMIIVVAIIAIVTGTVFIGIGVVTGKPAEKCANKLLSLMQRCRITTMGKLEARLEIYMEEDVHSGKKYLCVKEIVQTDGEAGPKVTTTRIGEEGVEASYRVSGDTGYQTLGSTPLIISYDRSSGAFKDLSAMGASMAGRYCEEIVIKKANKIVKLTLVTRTGKIIKE